MTRPSDDAGARCWQCGKPGVERWEVGREEPITTCDECEVGFKRDVDCARCAVLSARLEAAERVIGLLRRTDGRLACGYHDDECNCIHCVKDRALAAYDAADPAARDGEGA